MKCPVPFCAEETEAARSGSDRRDGELTRDRNPLSPRKLESAHEATTVRVRQASRSGGPFAETKERAARIVVPEAADIDEARSIASRSHLARIGSIAVRPILEETL